MQEILSFTRRAVDGYGMIENGDRIAVGVSGGKDSVLLLCALCRLREFYPQKFDVIAVTVDPRFDRTDSDFLPISGLCESLGVEHIVERTDIGEIVFDRREEKNPCSLCSFLRRGALIDVCERANANKLALAHHLDDAAETYMLNLIYEGRIGCFSPVTDMPDRGIKVIRPFVLLPEVKIRSAIKRLSLPTVKSACPADGATRRSEMKELLNGIDRKQRGVKRRIVGAMQRRNIDGWGMKTKDDI